MLFEEFINEWKGTCRLNVSDGWKSSQDQMIRDYILPFVGHLDIKNITHLHISKMISACKSKGRSQQTVKHVYSVLNSMFTAARDEFEIIGKSPVKPKLHRPHVISVERNFLTPEEAKVLLLAVESDEIFGLPIWLGIFCGLRIGEIQGIKWEDVDFQNASIMLRRVRNNKTNKFQNHTKNKTQLRVPMPEPLLNLMKARKGIPSDFVCMSESGSHFSRHTFAKALPRICERLGLKRLSAHELRHTCSELWIFHGASVEDVRRLLNHKSVSSTKGYIHRSDSRLQTMAKTVTCNLKAA